jgi:hypothetical protein
MAFRITSMVLGMVAVGALVGALLFGLRPEAQEATAPSDEDVSPAELELYIGVYTAMQADHDLTLDEMLVQKSTTLDQFRSIERRVQRQERLVRKVRDALTAQAKARADQFGPLAARPAPTAGSAPTATQ